jgi:hypothetical protein
MPSDLAASGKQFPQCLWQQHLHPAGDCSLMALPEDAVPGCLLCLLSGNLPGIPAGSLL